MSGLSYGLNLPKKGGGPGRPQPPKKKTIFDDDPSDDEGPSELGAQEISTFGDLSKPSSGRGAASAKPPSRPKAPVKLNPLSHGTADLSAKLSAGKHAAAAEELDPSIYDYDAAYDSMHRKPAKKKDPGSEGPQYMHALLESAEVRKRDQLRAKDKALALEREAEGDEYADKDKFVTGAYRAQQKEVQRLEEEERRHEEEAAARARREGGGLRGFYKGMLEREEARHRGIEEEMGKVVVGEEAGGDLDGEKEKEQAALAAAKGAVINEDGEVVDKRQLLSAGLNVVAKPATPKDARKADKIAPSASMSILQGRAAGKAAMRERQSRMMEDQLVQSTKRAAEEEIAEQETLKKAAKSRKTENEVSSAKERYLQRKREQEAAKAAGKEP